MLAAFALWLNFAVAPNRMEYHSERSFVWKNAISDKFEHKARSSSDTEKIEIFKIPVYTERFFKGGNIVYFGVRKLKVVVWRTSAEFCIWRNRDTSNHGARISRYLNDSAIEANFVANTISFEKPDSLSNVFNIKINCQNRETFWFLSGEFPPNQFHFKNGEIRPLSVAYEPCVIFCRTSGSVGILHTFAHINELPDEQPRLIYADQHQPRSEETCCIVRDPVPEGAWLYMSLLAMGAFLGGITLGRLITGPLKGHPCRENRDRNEDT